MPPVMILDGVNMTVLIVNELFICYFTAKHFGGLSTTTTTTSSLCIINKNVDLFSFTGNSPGPFCPCLPNMCCISGSLQGLQV